MSEYQNAAHEIGWDDQISVDGEQYVVLEFLLYARQLFGVGLVGGNLVFQAVHGVCVGLDDGVDLFIGQPHALQKFAS